MVSFKHTWRWTLSLLLFATLCSSESTNSPTVSPSPTAPPHNETTVAPTPAQGNSTDPPVSPAPTAANVTMPPTDDNSTSPAPSPAPSQPVPTTKVPTASPVAPPTPAPHSHHHHRPSLWRIIGKTIAWLFIIALAVLGFGAFMNNRYRIYYYARNLWFRFLRWGPVQFVVVKLRLERFLGGSHDANLNDIIFDNDMQEGLLMQENQ